MRDRVTPWILLSIAMLFGVFLSAVFLWPDPCPHDTPFSIDGGTVQHAPVSPIVWPDKDDDGGGEVLYFDMDGMPQVVRYEREVRIGDER